MIPIKMVTVCVNYDDFLAITLPRNARHMSEVLVVTAPWDERTPDVVACVPGARLHVTDAFRRYGATFNKGLAIEESWDVLGRKGWIAVVDADTLLPDHFNPSGGLRRDCLWSAPRRILDDPKDWHPGYEWRKARQVRDRLGLMPGYFHLFHADDPVLSQRPWYDVTFKHAGGGDGYFQSRWPRHLKQRFDFEVLHLGPYDANWFGRSTERLDDLPPSTTPDEMHRFMVAKGWRKDRGVVRRDPGYAERVDVPGHRAMEWVHR